MGCGHSVIEGPNTARHSLEKAIPLAVQEPKAGKKPKAAWDVFPDEKSRQSFIDNAITILGGNGKFKMRPLTVRLHYPPAPHENGYFGALAAYDRQEMVTSIRADTTGRTKHEAFQALVHFVDKMVGQLVMNPTICVLSTSALLSIREEGEEGECASSQWHEMHHVRKSESKEAAHHARPVSPTNAQDIRNGYGGFSRHQRPISKRYHRSKEDLYRKPPEHYSYENELSSPTSMSQLPSNAMQSVNPSLSLGSLHEGSATRRRAERHIARQRSSTSMLVAPDPPPVDPFRIVSLTGKVPKTTCPVVGRNPLKVRPARSSDTLLSGGDGSYAPKHGRHDLHIMSGPHGPPIQRQRGDDNVRICYQGKHGFKNLLYDPAQNARPNKQQMQSSSGHPDVRTAEDRSTRISRKSQYMQQNQATSEDGNLNNPESERPTSELQRRQRSEDAREMWSIANLHSQRTSMELQQQQKHQPARYQRRNGVHPIPRDSALLIPRGTRTGACHSVQDERQVEDWRRMNAKSPEPPKDNSLKSSESQGKEFSLAPRVDSAEPDDKILTVLVESPEGLIGETSETERKMEEENGEIEETDTELIGNISETERKMEEENGEIEETDTELIGIAK